MPICCVSSAGNCIFSQFRCGGHFMSRSNPRLLDEDFRVTVTGDRMFRKSAANNCVLKAEGSKLPNLPEMQYDMLAPEAIRFRLDRFYSSE